MSDAHALGFAIIAGIWLGVVVIAWLGRRQ